MCYIMKRLLLKPILLLIVAILTSTLAFAQSRLLDDFETQQGWEFILSDGVKTEINLAEGQSGKSIRFDYDFTKGTGYGGIQKLFPIDLPDNYEFTFYLKADSPPNNFEIKFIDSTGHNVWWVNNRNYDFPSDWKKIRIKKRHIHFAWGPTQDRNLKRIDRIEFTVASFVGGKGSLWIDELRFEPLPPETDEYPMPLITTSSSSAKKFPAMMTDGLDHTFWMSKNAKIQHVMIDFMVRREFGGLQIDWLEGFQASEFEILASLDNTNWEKIYTVKKNQGNVSFVRLPEAEARYLKLELLAGNSPKGFGIREIKFLTVRHSLTLNDFLTYASKNSPPGNYPRYFSEQASYWTVSGVNNDLKEALINEDGMVEVEKAAFSIEPMLRVGGELFNWSNVITTQSLSIAEGSENFSFEPTVTWNCRGIEFSTSVASGGQANEGSLLEIRYSFRNTTSEVIETETFLLIRPFQVNPYYQFLNLPGGAGKINNIRVNENEIHVDEKVIIPSQQYSEFGAAAFDAGNLVDMIRNGKTSYEQSVSDASGLANGVLKYVLKLQPGESQSFYLVIPYHDRNALPTNITADFAKEAFQESAEFWKSKVDHIKFNLPASADRIINSYKANLIYILINRDKAGIQPGSRSYERSWIRDGSLTSSALLKSGIVQEVRDFIDWYADHQYENGKVPCVVDFRGPDPVPEHDSHGQLIYLLREYFNFTHDTAFLKLRNENVLQAVNYIESLIAERSTDHYKYGNDSIRAHYGLVPESISHEGYSEKPMHSYWDNFFIMKGLKDAVDIQKILGNTEDYERIKKIRDTFRVNLYNSIDLAMKYKEIDYIPGCVELGDFDATSTTIALTPCNELKNLPKPQIYNTFEKYYTFFKNRRDGNLEWVNYTPYENRLIGSFILLDQPERAHELIDFFLNDQRPQGWYHWAEVVWKDFRIPRFIGDMPHTWVGSDFINALRSMFVYENEYDESLVLASALYQDWIDAPGGMSVEQLPTYYGDISFSVNREPNYYEIEIWGDVKLPDNGIRIGNFNGSKMPARVIINGVETRDFTEKEITVKECPSTVVIYY